MLPIGGIWQQKSGCIEIEHIKVVKLHEGWLKSRFSSMTAVLLHLKVASTDNEVWV